MTENNNNPTNDNPTNIVDNDPEFKEFQLLKKVNNLIAEYEKDDAKKAVLDAGLRDRLKEKPSIIENKDAFQIAFDAAKKEAIKTASNPPAKQPENQPADTTNPAPPPDTTVPAEQRKSIGSASLSEIQNVGKANLSTAVDARVFGKTDKQISMT